MQDDTTEIAIVGAGLSGLATAHALLNRGHHVTLFEAKARVGGRIHSLPGAGAPEQRYDLGPAWIWPHNTRMLDLVERLGFPLMRQHSTGNLIFQDQNNRVRRDLDFATMGDALRLPGGLARLAERLASDLPDGLIRLGHAVDSITAEPDGVALSGAVEGHPFEARCRKVILALPPRIAAHRIAFSPALSKGTVAEWVSVPTWMAGHAKLVAIYDRAFWRSAGFSGDAISHTGPLFEIHDATATETADGEAALFGFLTPQAAGPAIDREGLVERALAQLAILFGPEATAPSRVHLKNWAEDPCVATGADRADLGGHPVYQPIHLSDAPWPGRLFLSGTETAPENGGFLEGALEAAERVTALLEPEPAASAVPATPT